MKLTKMVEKYNMFHFTLWTYQRGWKNVLMYIASLYMMKLKQLMIVIIITK